jgi:hypothetical protein
MKVHFLAQTVETVAQMMGSKTNIFVILLGLFVILLFFFVNSLFTVFVTSQSTQLPDMKAVISPGKF